MRRLDMAEQHMLNSMKEKCEQLITRLVEKEEDFTNIVIIERIANILIIRLRKFIKEMSDDELYDFIKTMQSLKKMKAPQKHKLVKIIKEFWN